MSGASTPEGWDRKKFEDLRTECEVNGFHLFAIDDDPAFVVVIGNRLLLFISLHRVENWIDAGCHVLAFRAFTRGIEPGVIQLLPRKKNDPKEFIRSLELWRELG